MKLADRRGLEPRSAESESAVLPLDDLSMVGSGGLEPPRTCSQGSWATDLPNDPDDCEMKWPRGEMAPREGFEPPSRTE